MKENNKDDWIETFSFFDSNIIFEGMETSEELISPTIRIITNEEKEIDIKFYNVDELLFFLSDIYSNILSYACRAVIACREYQKEIQKEIDKNTIDVKDIKEGKND